MENMGFNACNNHLFACYDKEKVIRRKMEEITKQVKIHEGAYLASLPDLTKDKTYCYYFSERQRVNNKLDNENSVFDSKIAALEAKKKAFMEEIEAKIEKVENDKKIWQAKLDSEAARYEGEMNRVREKIESAVPTSLTYRKLKQSLEIMEQEEKEAMEETRIALQAQGLAMQKMIKAAQQENDRKEWEMKREEELQRQEAVAAEDRRLERENREYMERYKKREQEAKAAKVT